MKLAPPWRRDTVVMKPSELTPTTLSDRTLRRGRFSKRRHEHRAGSRRHRRRRVGREPWRRPSVVHGRQSDRPNHHGAAAGNLKRWPLNSGKNPHIIFADADLDVAVDYALNAVFFHAGQICSAGAKLLVESFTMPSS